MELVKGDWGNMGKIRAKTGTQLACWNKSGFFSV